MTMNPMRLLTAGVLLAGAMPVGMAWAGAKVAVAYSFKARNDGAYPDGLILQNGVFYGTTYNGGVNAAGTVFAVTPSGKETILHTFGPIGGGDGRQPPSGVIALGNTLYGVTIGGGTSDNGTVFSISSSGAETILHSFGTGTDGSEPVANLINVGGVLYGTTVAGGTGAACQGGCGTVFRITPHGDERVIYSFRGGSDGVQPYAPLLYSGGAFYGVTALGGKYGYGTVFKLTASGKETVLYSFKGGADGAKPVGGLAELNGDLYGTTEFGGIVQCDGAPGSGVVFRITKAGTETVLHQFRSGGADGYHTVNGLTAIGGVLYGTTGVGGAGGAGVLYSLTPAGHETILASFTGPPSVNGPNPQVLPRKGLLWGTSFYGGTGCSPAGGCGTLFSVKP